MEARLNKLNTNKDVNFSDAINLQAQKRRDAFRVIDGGKGSLVSKKKLNNKKAVVAGVAGALIADAIIDSLGERVVVALAPDLDSDVLRETRQRMAQAEAGGLRSGYTDQVRSFEDAGILDPEFYAGLAVRGVANTIQALNANKTPLALKSQIADYYSKHPATIHRDVEKIGVDELYKPIGDDVDFPAGEFYKGSASVLTNHDTLPVSQLNPAKNKDDKDDEKCDPCDTSDQYDSDGRICGGRSASMRAGGKVVLGAAFYSPFR